MENFIFFAVCVRNVLETLSTRVFTFIVDTCGAFRDLVPFVQFKKREKHSWRSVNSSKVAGHIKNDLKNYETLE